MHELVEFKLLSMPLIAQAFEAHHGWDGGWWWAMGIGMVLLAVVVIVAGAWLVRELAGRRGSEVPSPLDLLDRRLAEGAISVEEYEQRRRLLIEARGGGGGQRG